MIGDQGEVLRNAQSGDREALGKLIREHQPWVRRLMARLAPMGLDPDDLAQDVFVTVIQRLHSYEAESGDLKAWIFGIARHIASRAWESSRTRQAKYQPLIERTVEAALRTVTPYGQAVVDQTLGALRECVEALGSQSQELVRRRYRDQMSCESIGQSMGRNPASVRMTLTRIRAALRDCLKQRGVTALGGSGS